MYRNSSGNTAESELLSSSVEVLSLRASKPKLRENAIPSIFETISNIC